VWKVQRDEEEVERGGWPSVRGGSCAGMLWKGASQSFNSGIVNFVVLASIDVLSFVMASYGMGSEWYVLQSLDAICINISDCCSGCSASHDSKNAAFSTAINPRFTNGADSFHLSAPLSYIHCCCSSLHSYRHLLAQLLLDRRPTCPPPILLHQWH